MNIRKTLGVSSGIQINVFMGELPSRVLWQGVSIETKVRGFDSSREQSCSENRQMDSSSTKGFGLASETTVWCTLSYEERQKKRKGDLSSCESVKHVFQNNLIEFIQ
jgi:hypothetical protein